MRTALNWSEANEIEAWADSCIYSPSISPAGYYLATLYLVRGLARRLKEVLPPQTDPIDRIAAEAMREIHEMANAARRELGIPET